jgi:hypothetical protein
MKKMFCCSLVLFNFLTAVLVTLGSASAYAQSDAAKTSGTRYGVLSLIGDRLYVVTNQPGTATQKQEIQKIDLVMPQAVFDEYTLKAVDGLIKRAEPNADVKLLAANEPKLFIRQTDLLDAGVSIANLLPNVRDATETAVVDKLILITKFPDQAHAKMGKSAVAAGSFFGLGFYSENQQAGLPTAPPATQPPAKRVDKSAPASTATAFIAPYVYIQILLIDTKTWTVLKQETTAAATTRVVARPKDGAPTVSAYDAMSGKDKVATISKMLDYELSVMLPKLLAK